MTGGRAWKPGTVSSTAWYSQGTMSVVMWIGRAEEVARRVVSCSGLTASQDGFTGKLANGWR